MKFENMVTGFDSVLNSQINDRKTGYEDINEEMGDYLDDLSKFTPSQKQASQKQETTPVKQVTVEDIEDDDEDEDMIGSDDLEDALGDMSEFAATQQQVLTQKSKKVTFVEPKAKESKFNHKNIPE